MHVYEIECGESDSKPITIQGGTIVEMVDKLIAMQPEKVSGGLFMVMNEISFDQLCEELNIKRKNFTRYKGIKIQRNVTIAN